MDGWNRSEGRERGESPDEECENNQRPKEILQVEPASENEPVSEKGRCNSLPMRDAQDSECSKDPKELQVGLKNEVSSEPVNGKDRSDEKPLVDEQNSESSENPKEVEVDKDNEEPTNEKWRQDEIPTNVQDSNCSKDPKEIDAEEENKVSSVDCHKLCTKGDGTKRLFGSKNEAIPEDNSDKKPVRDVESSQYDKKPDLTQDERANTESWNEEWKRAKSSVESRPKSHLPEEAKKHQHDGGKQPDLGFVWIGVLVVPLLAYFLMNFQSNQEPADDKLLHVFLNNFEQVQKGFPNQEEQLWNRSRIMLQKQVIKTVHSEPSILMFVAAWDAEETMRCLTSQIARAYALSFSSRILEIDGTDKKFLNSDQVKLDLDNQLSSGFREGRKSAIIHHFQELPPASTLLFYKYCDHENAAFKDVSLLITVLVDEPRLDPHLSDALEEVVHDFLIMKFNVSSESGQYNVLDVDKFSGLWSRIAHAILLVQPEREIEENGCKQE